MSADVMNVSRPAMRSSRAVMKSLILKRSIMIAGQKTSVSLEDEFWQALKQIAAGLDMKMAELVHQIGSSASTETCPRRCGCSCSSTISAAPRPSATMKWCKARSAHRPEAASPIETTALVLRRGASHMSKWQAVFACVPVQ